MALATSCSGGAVKPSPSVAPTSKPTPTLPPVPAGGVVAMGRTVLTQTQSRVTVSAWRRGANRSIAPGPGQVYESVDVTFCAGPQVEESTQDLTPFFSLVLRNSNRVAPDSLSATSEFRTKGAVHANTCVSGPIVFQVSGGEKPAFVRFDSTPPTQWTVP